ncbi:hypothetical protein PG994_014038 [Apiospora phragmitis]|uniref:Uncharacterized protein n=1 Tax=Apiospora phragmitis TaxID=2905665 RepID=A0ABR1T4Q7_9PEZI
MSDSEDNNMPTILILCLGDKWMSDILDDPAGFGEGIDMLLEKANLKRAKTLSEALNYLNEHKPDGMLVADPGVVAKCNRELLGRLVAFAHYGGTVVFSFCFATCIQLRTWTVSGRRAGAFPGRWVTVITQPSGWTRGDSKACIPHRAAAKIGRRRPCYCPSTARRQFT